MLNKACNTKFEVGLKSFMKDMIPQKAGQSAPYNGGVVKKTQLPDGSVKK